MFTNINIRRFLNFTQHENIARRKFKLQYKDISCRSKLDNIADRIRMLIGPFITYNSYEPTRLIHSLKLNARLVRCLRYLKVIRTTVLIAV